MLGTNPQDVYIHTAAGTKVYPFAMTTGQVDIETIARHLACQNRWLGATRHRFLKDRISYSVAEHSVYVADFVEKELGRPDLAFEALMHDAAEAYCGDMIRPLKYSAAFYESFKAVEERIEKVISQRFSLSFPMKPEVKLADDAVCMAEWEQIVPRNPDEKWGSDVIKAGTIVRAAPIGIAMLSAWEAYELFMDRFTELLPRHEQITGRKIAA